MNDIATLLTSFDVSVIYAVSHKLADAVGMYLSPTLLIISIYIRLMETQIDAFAGTGKYGTALRDMMLWSFVLGSYYAIGNLIIDFVNPIYTWLDGFGSLTSTMKSFSHVLEQNKIASDNSGITLIGILSAPYALIAMLLYYFTLVIVAFIAAFLKIANALTFGVAFVWGLIAITVSISTTFNILRGWGLLLAFSLVWPIVQGLLMAMFAMLFTNSASTLMQIPDADATVRIANIMMLFAVMHLILAAVMVAAPFIANALVSNTSAASSIVMPFVAAATAAGVGAIKGAQVSGGITAPAAGGTASRLATTSNAYHTPTRRMAAASFAASGDQVADSGNASSNSAPLPRKADPSMQQQRRGAIIRQLLNKRRT